MQAFEGGRGIYRPQGDPPRYAGLWAGGSVKLYDLRVSQVVDRLNGQQGALLAALLAADELQARQVGTVKIAAGHSVSVQ